MAQMVDSLGSIMPSSGYKNSHSQVSDPGPKGSLV